MEGFRQDGNALIWEQSHEIVCIEPWGRDSLRVRSTAGQAIRHDLPGALLEPESITPEIEIKDERALITNGEIGAEVAIFRSELNPLALASIRFFRTATGDELLSEAAAYFPRPSARQYKHVGGDHFHTTARFQAYEDERIYGLGQHQHGQLDQKGQVVDMLQYNTEICIPFFYSTRGYGFLWNNPAVGRVELRHDVTRWVAEATQQIDYWVTCGAAPGDVMSKYADATGHAPPMPEWATGFWQCKLRYQTQEELLEVAREHKRRGLPMSVIVSDFFNWTLQGDWRFDPEAWPNPSAMVEELEEMGVRLMVSIWPTVNVNSENYIELAARGLLTRTESGVPAQMTFMDNNVRGAVMVQFYDATNPEARDYIWERVKEGYYRHGIKVWWLDACEPAIRPRHPENLRFHLGNGLAVMNIYPLLHEKAFYDGMRAEGEEEIITLCRSGWAGSQRYAACLWSGDIPSTFEALQDQVRAGLNTSMSGIPWWNTDIGGFFGGDVRTPTFRELIVRWFQYGCFCPLFRLHGFRLPNGEAIGSGGPNEVWSFGEEAYEIIKGILFLRERLRPYIMEQMERASKDGTPPMRPLFYDFHGDQEAYEVEDEFMFGSDLLVAPILEEGARERRVYLPSGATWTDAWSDEVFEGGQWLEVDAPLERIPLYLRDGATLPIREED